MNEITAKDEAHDLGAFLLRLMLGGLLLFHGVSKALNGIDWIKASLVSHHLPALIAYGVFIGEILAPLLILAGIWTRVSAIVVVIDLVVAILLVRLPSMFAISKSGGWAMEQDFFFLLSALALAFIGPGRLRLGRGKGALG